MPRQSKGRSSRSENTVNGRIEWRRTRWHSKQEGSDTLLDRLLDAAESTISLGVRELCCRLGIDAKSFARAAKNLGKSAGIHIGEELLRQVVQSQGKAVLRAGREEQLELDWSAAACKTSTPQGQEVSRIYVSADGVMVPVTTQTEKDKRRKTVRGWRRAHRSPRGVRRGRLRAVKKGEDQRYKQFFVTEFYSQEHERKLVGVTRGDHRKLGRLLRKDAARVRLPGAKERHGLIDGAVCLKRHLEGLGLSEVGLDFYHGIEHVKAAAKETLGSDASGKALPAAQKWADQMVQTLREEGYDPFWEKLCQWRSQQRGNKRASADRLLHYVAERKDMMNYVEWERRGLHIGTGPVESMCKVTTQRIKGPGMRWDAENAEAMMALEALEQSGLWDRYWAKALADAN